MFNFPCTRLEYCFLLVLCKPYYLGPLIYLSEPKKLTVAIALRLFETQQSQHIPETMAMTLVALIPVLLVFYFGQARFIQGIVISGVKG